MSIDGEFGRFANNLSRWLKARPISFDLENISMMTVVRDASFVLYWDRNFPVLQSKPWTVTRGCPRRCREYELHIRREWSANSEHWLNHLHCHYIRYVLVTVLRWRNLATKQRQGLSSIDTNSAQGNKTEETCLQKEGHINRHLLISPKMIEGREQSDEEEKSSQSPRHT